jgi:uncharacterized protein YndB with AHSA1/START domain
MAIRSESSGAHTASRHIEAPPDRIYEAYVEPENLRQWLAPKGARCEIRHFEPWEGGRFEFVLTFGADIGKSSVRSDVVTGRFERLSPDRRIVQTVEFVSDRLEFAGTMRMSWSMSVSSLGTLVKVVAEDVPSGIDRADHELGMASTLENLARFVEQDRTTSAVDEFAGSGGTELVVVGDVDEKEIA